MRKYTYTLMAAAIGAAVLTGCGGSTAAAPAATTAEATTAAAAEAPASEEKTEAAPGPEGAKEAAAPASGELKEFDVVLDWYPNAVHTFLFEADKNGYFAEEGLKVNIINPADTVDALTFVASEKAQIGFSYPVDVIMANVNEGMPVKALAAVVQEELSCMASLADSDITADMSSLKGKTVGHSGPAVMEATVKTISKNAGLSEDDVKLLNVGFDLTTALTTKSADMVVGTFINDEIVTMKNAGYDVNVWRYDDYGVPMMYGLVMAVNADAYDADPESYQGFIRACKKGFEDMKDEDKALQTIMADMNSDDNPLDEVQQKESYEILMPLMEKDGQPFLSMSDKTWEDIMSWMADSGLIEAAVGAGDICIQE
ncbi:MAG: ABC transporter substrate-binding protein [Eubacteriales bacterium]|nr:ABC transporter substrate-binding protein [Eubacteriales bacterium]